MCGICGVYGSNDKELIKKMTDVMTHRGPDDSGYYISDDIVLGHRRLSIIDLYTGKQPIHNEDESVWIVFNGEIYNFDEIRKNLENLGHRFYTNTDTEVILHSYEEYGENCVSLLNGMFAFAIWDENKKQLFLARDRLGKKPLHYTVFDGKFLFASELKSILQYPSFKREVNINALNSFLTYLYIPSPETIFRGTSKLPPAHTLTYRNGKISIKKYWDLDFSKPIIESEEYYIENIYNFLRDSVKRRMISDVPLGAFLSGGIDSSTVVAFMSKVTNEPIKTFSIGFEESSYSELKYARIVSEYFNTDHHEFIVNPDITDLLQELIVFLDEPFADSSIIPTYLVSKLTRQHVTVALSGDGGDELFAGYRRYTADTLAKYYNVIPEIVRKRIVGNIIMKLPVPSTKNNIIEKAKRFIERESFKPVDRYISWRVFFNNKEKEELLVPEINDKVRNLDATRIAKSYFEKNNFIDFLSRCQYTDIKTYLTDDILVKVDRMSMANSLEVRAPLLDYTLVEFTTKIPSNFKLRGLTTKYILKKLASRLLPNTVVNRKKQGFSIPANSWLKCELKDFASQILFSRERSPYFNQNYVEKIFDLHQKGKHDFSNQIWGLLTFELWYRKYMEET